MMFQMMDEVRLDNRNRLSLSYGMLTADGTCLASNSSFTVWLLPHSDAFVMHVHYGVAKHLRVRAFLDLLSPLGSVAIAFVTFSIYQSQTRTSGSSKIQTTSQDEVTNHLCRKRHHFN